MEAFRAAAAAAAAAQLRRPRRWLPSYRFPPSSSLVRELDQVALEDLRLESVREVVHLVGRSDYQGFNSSRHPDPGLVLGVATLYPGLFTVSQERRRLQLVQFTPEMEKLHKDELRVIGSRDQLLSINILRKMLMMANNQEILLDKFRWTRKEFGLPEDFHKNLVLNHPKHFKVSESKRGDSLHLETWDQQLAITAREKSLLWDYKAPRTGFHLVVEAPISDEYDHFQKLIFPSPYEFWKNRDASPCLVEKRAMAVLHEILSFMPNKRCSLAKLELFRSEMSLPNDILFFLLRHPGIFYVCRAVEPPCIFLRESFFRGELKYKSPEDLIRDRYLILMSRKPVEF